MEQTQTKENPQYHLLAILILFVFIKLKVIKHKVPYLLFSKNVQNLNLMVNVFSKYRLKHLFHLPYDQLIIRKSQKVTS